MITADENYLSRPEDEKVRTWLMDPACELFLDSLASEQALNEVTALGNIIRRRMAGFRDESIPVNATKPIADAADLAIVIRILREKMNPDSLFHATSLTVTSNA